MPKRELKGYQGKRRQRRASEISGRQRALKRLRKERQANIGKKRRRILDIIFWGERLASPF